DTILVSRKGFTASDLALLGSLPQRSHIQVIYKPGAGGTTPFGQLLLATDLNRFYQNYPFDVRPVSDDRPFFFYTVQSRDLWGFVLHASRATADYKINSALPVLFGLLVVSLVAMAVIISLPPLLLGHRLPRTHGAIPSLLFFLFIGAGYIIIQVALIQRFVLFLGHPTYALTVIIFSMLLSSGIGSFLSRVFVKGLRARLLFVLLTVTGAVIVLSEVLAPITEGGVTLPFVVKVLVSASLIAPLGFLMGMPFPTGLAMLERTIPVAV